MKRGFNTPFCTQSLKAAHCTTNEPAHLRLSSYSCPVQAQAKMQLPMSESKSCMLGKAALQPAILNRDQLPSGSELASECLSDPKTNLCAK